MAVDRDTEWPLRIRVPRRAEEEVGLIKLFD
jgi:hypothetical protein